jgi:hypothetical protein
MYDGWKAQEKSSALLPIYDTDMTYLPNVIIHPTTTKFPWASASRHGYVQPCLRTGEA